MVVKRLFNRRTSVEISKWKKKRKKKKKREKKEEKKRDSDIVFIYLHKGRDRP